MLCKEQRREAKVQKSDFDREGGGRVEMIGSEERKGKSRAERKDQLAERAKAWKREQDPCE